MDSIEEAAKLRYSLIQLHDGLVVALECIARAIGSIESAWPQLGHCDRIGQNNTVDQRDADHVGIERRHEQFDQLQDDRGDDADDDDDEDAGHDLACLLQAAVQEARRLATPAPPPIPWPQTTAQLRALIEKYSPEGSADGQDTR